MRSLISSVFVFCVFGFYAAFSGYLYGANVYSLLKGVVVMFFTFLGVALLPAIFLDLRYGRVRAKTVVVLLLSVASVSGFILIFFVAGRFAGSNPLEIVKFSLWVTPLFFLFLQAANIFASRRKAR